MSFDDRLRQEHAARKEALPVDADEHAIAASWEEEVRGVVVEAISRLATAGYPNLERLPVEKQGFRFRTEHVEGWRFGDAFLTVDGGFRYRTSYPNARITSEPLALWQMFRCGQEDSLASSLYYAPEHVDVVPASTVQDRLVRLLADLGIE